jgi:hypothetical protein
MFLSLLASFTLRLTDGNSLLQGDSLLEAFIRFQLTTDNEDLPYYISYIKTILELHIVYMYFKYILIFAVRHNILF